MGTRRGRFANYLPNVCLLTPKSDFYDKACYRIASY